MKKSIITKLVFIIIFSFSTYTIRVCRLEKVFEVIRISRKWIFLFTVKLFIKNFKCLMIIETHKHYNYYSTRY